MYFTKCKCTSTHHCTCYTCTCIHYKYTCTLQSVNVHLHITAHVTHVLVYASQLHMYFTKCKCTIYILYMFNYPKATLLPLYIPHICINTRLF